MDGREQPNNLLIVRQYSLPQKIFKFVETEKAINTTIHYGYAI